MKYFIILSLWAVSSLNAANELQERYERWWKAGDSWYSRWMRLADESSVMTNEEKISTLGSALWIAKDKKIELTEEQSEVYRRIQGTLLKNPGHAEYFANRIKKERLTLDNQPDDTPYDDGPKIRLKQKLLHEQRDGFQTLQQLPSPETIRVLGEFLTDERGRMVMTQGVYDYFGRSHSWQQEPNSVWAARTLHKMPLKNKPHAAISEFDDGQPPTEWINWYTQIKEGRRTFSFEGDPNEYDLNGIVREAKNPDIPRMTKRPSVVGETPSDSSKRIKPMLVP